MYRIEFKKSVKKDLKNISRYQVNFILEEIEALENGIDNNENIIKLKGNNPYYRLKLGDYRIIFEKFDDKLVILVIKIGHRRDVYKRIK
jgi:mRNA interferase RelE/StbE